MIDISCFVGILEGDEVNLELIKGTNRSHISYKEAI